MNETVSDRQLLEAINQRLIRIERRQKAASIRTWVITGLVVALLIALTVFLVPKIRFLVQQYKTVVSYVEEAREYVRSIDTEKIKSTLDSLGNIDTGALGRLIDKFSEIDFNEILKRIETALEPFEGIASWFKK